MFPDILHMGVVKGRSFSLLDWQMKRGLWGKLKYVFLRQASVVLRRASGRN